MDRELEYYRNIRTRENKQLGTIQQCGKHTEEVQENRSEKDLVLVFHKVKRSG